jgi:hypothetical protein
MLVCRRTNPCRRRSNFCASAATFVSFLLKQHSLFARRSRPGAFGGVLRPGLAFEVGERRQRPDSAEDDRPRSRPSVSRCSRKRAREMRLSFGCSRKRSYCHVISHSKNLAQHSCLSSGFVRGPDRAAATAASGKKTSKSNGLDGRARLRVADQGAPRLCCAQASCSPSLPEAVG